MNSMITMFTNLWGNYSQVFSFQLNEKDLSEMLGKPLNL